MKKKLLLVGVAAMGLLAVGVGATSTFAWYSATSAGATLKANSAESAMIDTTASKILMDLPIVIEIAQDATPTVALTDPTTGNIQAVQNGGVADAALVDGQQKYGGFVISARWAEVTDSDDSNSASATYQQIHIGANYYPVATAGQRLAASGSYGGFTVSNAGNVRLLASDNTDGIAPTGSPEWKFVVYVDTDGTLKCTANDTSYGATYITEGNNKLADGTGGNAGKVVGRFAVKPNNYFGVEVGGANGTTGLPGAYDAGTSYSKGQAVSYSGKYWVYINDTPATGQTPAEGSYWTEATLHNADKITVA